MKHKVRQPEIKIGGGAFLQSYIRSMDKKTFIETNLASVSDFHPAPEQYLSDVWDLAHRDLDFKTRTNLNNDELQDIEGQVPAFDSIDVIKPATKRKQTNKKE